MSGIRGKNTKPELLIRSTLHAAGFRFRIHANLPGKPDLAFPKWGAVIFVHGCFWHGHNCHLFKWPQSRPEFWQEKISKNVMRDKGHVETLLKDGWRVGIIWECALKGRERLDINDVVARSSAWLKSNRKMFELSGATNAKRSAV